MTNEDIPNLAELLALLSEAFNESMSDVKAEAYFLALNDLAIEDVKRAAHIALKTETYFPRPVKIREIVQGSINDQAEAAWAKLIQQIRWEGYTGKPQLSDEIWDVVRELWGSWVNLCQTLPGEGPELLGWAKRFKSCYGSAQRVAARMALPTIPARAELSE